MLKLELKIVMEILVLLGIALSALWGLCVWFVQKCGPEIVRKVVIDLVSAAVVGVIVIAITRDPKATTGASLAGWVMSHCIQNAITRS